MVARCWWRCSVSVVSIASSLTVLSTKSACRGPRNGAGAGGGAGVDVEIVEVVVGAVSGRVGVEGLVRQDGKEVKVVVIVMGGQQVQMFSPYRGLLQALVRRP